MCIKKPYLFLYTYVCKYIFGKINVTKQQRNSYNSFFVINVYKGDRKSSLTFKVPLKTKTVIKKQHLVPVKTK